MKQLIAFLLMPVAAILLILKLIFEPLLEFVEIIKVLLEEPIEKNYEFWAKVFKWEE